jgi:hypothetical protein
MGEMIKEIKNQIKILNERLDYIEFYLDRRSRGFFLRNKNR